MKKIYFLSIIFLMAFSCRGDQRKIDFISKVIKNPARLETIIKTTKTHAGPFRDTYFKTDSSRLATIDFLAKRIETFIQPGFVIGCNQDYEFFDKGQMMRERYHDIELVSRDSSRAIMFRWVFISARWELKDIFFTNPEFCK